MKCNLILGTFALLSLTLAACAVDTTSEGAPSTEESATAPADKSDDSKESKENVGEAQSALLSGFWTTITSDEYAPLSCPSGYLVDAMEALGSDSDNIALHCGSIGRAASNQAWSAYFSEEGPKNWDICGTNRFIVGIACKGDYCDDISIQCASFANTARGSNCYWTPWFSEEQQYQYLFSGYAAAGIQCSGSNCDNMSIYACPIVLN